MEKVLRYSLLLILMISAASCQSEKQMKAEISYKAWLFSSTPELHRHDLPGSPQPWLDVELRTPEDLAIAKGFVAAEPSCKTPAFTMDYLDRCSMDARESPEWKNYNPVPVTSKSYGKIGYTSSECVISESKQELTRARSFGMQSKPGDQYETLPSYTLLVLGRISGEFCWVSVAFGKYAGVSGYVKTTDIRERYAPVTVK